MMTNPEYNIVYFFWQISFLFKVHLKILMLYRTVTVAGGTLCTCAMISWYNVSVGDRGGTVVKVVCYKSEGRWFDPR